MTRHPAKYNDQVLDAIDQLLDGSAYYVLDPFAGVGKIHNLYPKYWTVGVEIEPEWASQHQRTMVGNALRLLFPESTFDAIATSPCYGNRLADHHNARDASRRNTYTHALGRPLHKDNSGALQWGPKYRVFHVRAWVEAIRVLKPGGVFVLNISDHIRAGEVAPVTTWHRLTLRNLGLVEEKELQIPTPRLRHGANYDLRVEHESVIRFTKPLGV